MRIGTVVSWLSTMKNSLKLLAIAAMIASVTASFAQKPHPKIATARAEKIALAKYHGKLAGKTELENEDGKWQYAVMVKTGKTMREVMVDAMSGKIVNTEVVTAAEEAREKAAEAKHKKKSGN